MYKLTEEIRQAENHPSYTLTARRLPQLLDQAKVISVRMSAQREQRIHCTGTIFSEHDGDARNGDALPVCDETFSLEIEQRNAGLRGLAMREECPALNTVPGNRLLLTVLCTCTLSRWQVIRVGCCTRTRSAMS